MIYCKAILICNTMVKKQNNLSKYTKLPLEWNYLFKVPFLGLINLLLFSGCSGSQELVSNPSTNPKIIKNEIVYKGDTPYLYRAGRPYYVNGAACNNFFDQVGKYGGNSIRTYSINNETQKILDSAYSKGLSVVLGIGLKKERDHGFDYDDQALVKKQFQEVKQQVLKFKDHPAILMWGIGNELDIEYTKPSVWDAVEDISKFIHQVDTLHLTGTILAGADVDDIEHIIARAPSLDLIGVNVYADIVTAHENIKLAGWKKPYLITEWGPKGTWDNPKSTDWGRFIEPTSSEKADKYYKNYYDHYIYRNKDDGCVGSYVFLWGYQNHGAVQTWYGLFTRKGNPLNAVQTMQQCWTGKQTSNASPKIEAEDLVLNGKTAQQDIRVKVGDMNVATIDALDPDGDNLNYEWHIIEEDFVLKKSEESKGFNILPSIPGLIENNKTRQIHFSVSKKGEYRLVVYVLDPNGNASLASIPFLAS